MGTELAPEKVLFSSWVMLPPLSTRNMGAMEPRIMLMPMGMETAMPIRNTTNTNTAAVAITLRLLPRS